MRTLVNSLFVSLTITVCVTLTSMLVGYAVAKTEFRGKNAFRNLLIVQMVFPVFMFIIPQFVLMRELGLINSYGAMILPYAMSAWGIFMVSQSFKGTPNDYLYAARLDHASLWGILRHVMMPLNKSILAIVALFTFSSSWDNFLWPLIVMREVDKCRFRCCSPPSANPTASTWDRCWRGRWCRCCQSLSCLFCSENTSSKACRYH